MLAPQAYVQPGPGGCPYPRRNYNQGRGTRGRRQMSMIPSREGRGGRRGRTWCWRISINDIVMYVVLICPNFLVVQMKKIFMINWSFWGENSGLNTCCFVFSLCMKDKDWFSPFPSVFPPAIFYQMVWEQGFKTPLWLCIWIGVSTNKYFPSKNTNPSCLWFWYWCKYIR